MRRLVLSKKNKKRNLVVHSNPDSIISEQFRTIRTNIHFINGDEKSSTILITSPGRYEGKSTVAANIAVSMTQQNEKILLIDGNIREPGIHSIFKISNVIGLTDVLTGKVPFDEAVTASRIGMLDILTGGTQTFNPAELLSSPEMKKLLKTVKPLYDNILIDSPGLLELTDSKVLANRCDGVVLVIRKNKTKLDSVFESKRVLELAKTQLIGAIVNE